MEPTSLITEFKRGLELIYGDRLRGTYLFGSYARGQEDPESDVDLLIVLDRIDRYVAEVEQTSRLASDLSLKYRISISRVFVTERDWLSSETAFLANARQEAVPA